MRRTLAILLGLVSALGAFSVSPAGAADPVVDKTPQKGAQQLQISRIDATDPSAVDVRFTWNGDVEALKSMTVRQNGNQVQASNPEELSADKIDRATVVVLDQSGSMVSSGGLDVAVTKIRQMIDKAPDNARFGIVTFGSEAVVAQSMTDDKEALNSALDQIEPDTLATTALWDGVVAGVHQLNTLPDYEHNLIVLTDGTDDSSTVNAAAARGAVAGSGQDTGSMVFAMGITQQNALDEEGLTNLVKAGGGRLFVADDAKNIGDAFDQVDIALGNEFSTHFESLPGSRGSNALTMSISGITAEASFTVGGVAQGATRLAPTVSSGSSAPAFFSTTGGLVLGMVLIALAFGVVAFIVIQMLTARQSSLDAALNPYTEGFAGVDGELDGGGGLSDNALLQRALSMTENFAEQQGFLESVEAKLEMAEVPLKAGEALLIWLAATVVLGIVGFIFGGLVIGVILLAAVILLGPAFLNFKAAQRQRKFETQLPDTLTLLAGALRAGFSLMQAVDAVSQEVQNPMGREMRRVVSETRLGRDLEEALEDTAIRMGSPDFSWAVMAIRIQREVGGNLAELLMTVADTMIQRERLRREVKALTAEGRMSAYVLACLPPGLGVVLYMSNPEYMQPLFSDSLGQVLLALSLLGMIVGFFWMQKVVQIDV